MTVRAYPWFIIAAGTLCCGFLSAQVPQGTEEPVVFIVEGENSVLYRGNTFDFSKIAKDPNPTTSVNTAFLTFVNVGDLRTVNGKPAKGLWSSQGPVAMPYRASPQPGQPIADMDSSGIFQCIWHILSPDGKYIGTLTDTGAAPGPDHIIIGGSGAFQGVTGLHSMMQALTPQRGASTSEDPANRRIHGGGKFRTVFYLYPKSRPTVIMTSTGPAVYHPQDWSPVTAEKPARAGEWVIMSVSGLGLTKPSVDPGKPFPAYGEPLCLVNSPVEATVNGNPSQTANAVGWPETVGIFRVDVLIPADTAPGMAKVSVSAAWINGPEVNIPVR